MDEPLVMNEDYLLNAFERVLRRRNLDPATALSNMDLAHKAEIMAEVCVFAAQSFTYFGDSYERHNRRTGEAYDATRMHNPFEHMQNMGVAYAGDCEDGFKFILLVHSKFCDIKLTDKRLLELQRIARSYIFFGVLATVHGAKAEDKTEHIGAHMYGILMPRYHVLEALKRTPDGARFEAALQTLINGVDKDDPLPTLFCEGTGRIRPLGTGPIVTLKHIVRSSLPANHPGSYDPLYNERRYVSSMRAKAGMKTEIPHDMGAESAFYLGNMIMITPAFLRMGFNLGSFICGKIDETSGEITRGVPFTDLVNQRSNMALVPMPALPEPVMAVTREAVALRVPSRPLTLTYNAPYERTHTELDRLKRGVAALKRNGTSPYGSVDIFMRPHQFNARTIDCFLDEIQRMPRIYKVDYEVERITDSLRTWRVMLYVDSQ